MFTNVIKKADKIKIFIYINYDKTCKFTIITSMYNFYFYMFLQNQEKKINQQHLVKNLTTTVSGIKAESVTSDLYPSTYTFEKIKRFCPQMKQIFAIY